MGRDWEAWLAAASGPASPTEEQERDRTEKRIRDAITAATDIPSSVRVHAKGSYASNTNVRRDADVDIAVEWNETIKVMTWGDTTRMTPAQFGYTPADEPVTPAEFRHRLERAMIAAFGAGPVDTTPDKHIGVGAGASTLDADVAPCFALNRYDAPRLAHRGHRIFPKSGGFVDNYPKQNHDNGVAKNNATGRCYKEIVRCVKRLGSRPWTLCSTSIASETGPGRARTPTLAAPACAGRGPHTRRRNRVRSSSPRPRQGT